MSSKKKNIKVGWVEIASGEYLLESGKNAEQNESFSESFAKNSSSINKENTSCIPVVSNGVFHAEVATKKTKEVKLAEHQQERMVEIHPATMQLCGMKISGPVLVHDTATSFTACAYRVWPSTHVALGKVGLSLQQQTHNSVKVGSFVYVTKPSFNVASASAIQLTANTKLCDDETSTFFTSSHFLKFISLNLDRTFIADGQKIKLTYFGKPFYFTVNEINGDRRQGIEDKDKLTSRDSATFEDVSNLEKSGDSLSILVDKLKLDLNDSQRHDMTSTPVRSRNLLSESAASDSVKKKTVSEAELSSTQVYMITSKTEISILTDNTREANEQGLKTVSSISFADIGGLTQQIKLLQDLVILPMKNFALFKKAGIQFTHGVLLHGPPGTGKSMLAKALATEVGGHTEIIRGTEIMSRFFGESEKQLRSIFKRAISYSSCVVIMDEIDALCPRRETSRADVEKRIVASLISLLDEINGEPAKSGHVVVIATTNRVDSIDPALRRAGRFDREVEINIPTSTERVQILNKLLSKTRHDITSQQLESLADKCHGYVGADLSAVCVEAGLSAFKRAAQEEQHNCSVLINVKDVEYGIKQIPPSAMRELLVQVPQVFWSDIGGNEAVKKKLKQAIEWPLKIPEAFKTMGIDPPKGVLMYGPPGCSKTLTAKALATESGLNFISIKGPELFSKYVGDSERAIRRLFAKARSAAPSIVFVDELDALAIERGSGNVVADRVLAALLTEMDGVEQRNDVIVVAATNRPDMIDKAFLRPGRIDRLLHVPLPDSSTRREIFRIHFRKMPIASDVLLEDLVEKTAMHSGAEISAVCREAALAALDEDIEASLITMAHFKMAIESVLPQTTPEWVQFYEEYEKRLQSRIK